MINDLRCRLPKRRIGIIAKSHNDLFTVWKLSRFGVRAGREGIADEAVDGYDTVQGSRQRTAVPTSDARVDNSKLREAKITQE